MKVCDETDDIESIDHDFSREDKAITDDADDTSNHWNIGSTNEEEGASMLTTSTMTGDSALYDEDGENISNSSGSKETAGKEENGLVNAPRLRSEKSAPEETSSEETPKRSQPAQLMRSEGRRLVLDSTECTPQQKQLVRRCGSDIKSLVHSSTTEQSFHETDPERNGAHTPMGNTQQITDLLANFIEYKDQIPSTPSCPRTSIKQKPMSARTSRKSWPMSESKVLRPSTTPLPKSSRQLGVEKRQSLPVITDIPRPILKKRQSLLSSMAPEGLRGSITSSRQEVGLARHHWINDVHVEREKPATRIDDLKRMAMTCLSTAVKIFCTTCIVARCLTFIGSKRSLLLYIAESPVVWIVRFYILVFHAVLIMIEMRIGIPGILPHGSLDNYIHRAFMQSFVGLVDILFNSNKTLVDHVVSGEAPDDETAKWVELSYAVLRVSPRGLLFCSVIYFILAVFGKDGSFNERKTTKSQTEFEV